MSGHSNRTLPRALAIVATIALACTGQKDEPKLTSVVVSPASSSLAKGTSQQLVATALFSNNSKKDVTALAEWKVSDAAVLKMTAPGVAKGLGVGPATVTATYKAVLGSAALSVTPAEIVALAITPDGVRVPKGVDAQLTATARFTDDTVQDVTQDAAWTSSASTVAECTGTCGQVKAVGVGEALVTASLQGKQASTKVTVTDAQLITLVLSPANSTLPVGMTQQMTATGTFTDQSVQDLTKSVKWCSLHEEYAAISNAIGTEGLVTALAEGPTEICASYCDVFTVRTNLTVTPAIARSITITPAEASVPKGHTVVFRASAVFTDNSSRDVTADAVWTAEGSEGGAATIEIDGDEAVAKGTGVGPVAITAKVAGSDAAGTAALTVTAAIVERIEVSPPAPSVAAGFDQQFTATAYYSDETTGDVTASMTWTSSSEAVAVVDNDTRGLAHAKAMGQATIQAKDPVSGHYGEAVLTVTEALLQGVAISPASPADLHKGLDQQFALTGHFSDHTTKDLTSVADWTTSDAAIASVSASAPGKAHGEGVGDAQITGAHGGFSATATLKVIEARLDAIAVVPAEAKIPKGDSTGFVAYGHYSDGSSEDITSNVTWSSSDTAIATVANGANAGLAFGAGAGEATITAASGEVSGTAKLTVTREVLRKIEVTPPAPIVPLGLKVGFTATGIYSDGSKYEITETVTWTSSSPAAFVHNDLGEEGIVETSATGKDIVITATYPGLDVAPGTATLTITDAILVAIEIQPQGVSRAKGVDQQYTATGTFTFGLPIDITSQVTWTSSDGSVASIAPGGFAETLGEGVTTIKAAFPGSPVTAATSLTVTPAELRWLEIAPTSASIPKGLSQAFTVIGVYTDDTKPDLTGQVNWESSDPLVAFMAGNVAHGATMGDAVITATFPGTTISASASLNVSEEELVSITVAPLEASIPEGNTSQFKAFGLYTDDTTRDLTELVLWESSDAKVQVSNAGPDWGLATALHGSGGGSYTITASMEGKSGSATLAVTSAVLKALEIAQVSGEASLPKGLTAAYEATGVLTNGDRLDYTALVTWHSTDGTIAFISNEAGKQGQVSTGPHVGIVQITATADDPQNPGAAITSNALDLTVNREEIVSIEISPEDQVLPKGLWQQFKADGTYTDGSVRDVTAAVIWESSDTNVVDILNAPVVEGKAFAKNVGTVTISARFPGSTISDATSFEVTAAVLTGLEFVPPDLVVPEGVPQPFAVVGTYSDGSVLDVTAQAGLSVVGPAAVVDLGGGVFGLNGTAACVDLECPAAVTASMLGWNDDPIAAAMAVTVIPDAVDSLTFVPADVPPTTQSEQAFVLVANKVFSGPFQVSAGDPSLAVIAPSYRWEGDVLVVQRTGLGPVLVQAVYDEPDANPAATASVLVDFVPATALSAYASVVPAIDGALPPGEWDDAACTTAPAFTMCVKNDETNIYAVIVYANQPFTDPPNALFMFAFDENGNGVADVGEDAVWLVPGVGANDLVMTDGGIASDTDVGGTADVVFAATTPAAGEVGTFVLEWSHPFAGGDANDFNGFPGAITGIMTEWLDAANATSYGWPTPPELAVIGIAAAPPPQN